MTPETNIAESPAMTAPTETVAEWAGVPEGTVLQVAHPDNSTTQEKIVHDYDAEGVLIGWHKEVVNG